jgi:hypothetical protein
MSTVAYIAIDSVKAEEKIELIVVKGKRPNEFKKPTLQPLK